MFMYTNIIICKYVICLDNTAVFVYIICTVWPPVLFIYNNLKLKKLNLIALISIIKFKNTFYLHDFMKKWVLLCYCDCKLLLKITTYNWLVILLSH